MADLENTPSRSSTKLKFLCSYDGQIIPRRVDGKLIYVGGFTRILSVPGSISFAELMVKLCEFSGGSVILKCKLPTEDLETLVTVSSDDDLRDIVRQYEMTPSKHPLQIRAILCRPPSLKSVSSPVSKPVSPPISKHSSPRSVAGFPVSQTSSPSAVHWVYPTPFYYPYRNYKNYAN